MAINTIQGFNPSTTEPIDSRVTVANETARLAFATFNVYEGLVVYQEDTDELYVLNDAANPDQTSSWSTVGGGSGFPFTGSAEITGSLDLIGDVTITGSLDMSGSINLTGDRREINILGDDGQVALKLNDTNAGATDTGKVGWYINGTLYGSIFANGGSPTDGLIIRSESSRAITFKTNGNFDRMIIQQDGNVGIGTTDPQTPLHVNGHISSSRLYTSDDVHVGDDLFVEGNLIRLTGTGTNYIQTTSGDLKIQTALGDDIIIRPGGTDHFTFKDSGRLGIGTTSPGSPLTVAGRVDFQNDLRLRGTDSAANQGVTRFFVDSDNKLHIDTANDGSNEFIIDSSGKVGIGTTAPTSKLHLFSSTHSDFLDNGILLEVSSSDEGEPAIAFRNQSDMGSNYWIAGINNGGGNLDFAYGSAFTSANTKVRFASNGNVGIGTTNPSGTIHSYKATDNYVYIERGGGAALKLLAASNRADFGTSNNHPFNITTNNQIGLTLDTSQNVGIGTTTPSTKFHVDGNIRVGDANDVIYTNKLHGLSIGDLTVHTSGNTLLTQTGNVGIGTTNPTEKLHVQDIGTSGVTGSMLFKNDNNDYTHLYVQSNGYGFRLSAHAGSKNGYIVGNGALNFASQKSSGGSTAWFGNGSLFKVMNPDDGYSTPFILNHNNRVGIGTTSPQTKLHLSGSTGADSGIRQSRAGVKIWDQQIDSSGRLIWSHYASEGGTANQLLTLDDNNNVGIGTTSPTEKLTVEGNISVNGTISTPNNVSLRLYPSGSSGQIFFGSPTDGTTLYHYSRANNGENTFFNFDAGYYVITTNDQNGIKLNNDVLVAGDLTVGGKVTAQEFHTEFVSASIVYNSGSTKFGDTSDDVHQFTGSLHIQTSGSAGANRLKLTTAAGIDVASIYNGNSDTTPVGTLVLNYGNTGAAILSGQSNGLSIRGGYTTNGTIRFNSYITEIMRVTGTGLGIGTTSPAYTLDVSGSARVDGRFYFATDGSGNNGLDFRRVGSNVWSLDTSGVGEIYRISGNSITFKQDTIIQRGGLTVAPTLSAPTHAIKVDHTWNSDSTDFRTLDINVTNTTASLDSNIIDVSVDGTTNFVLDQDFNLGIGTTSPSYKLHVNGTAQIGEDSSGLNNYLYIQADTNKARYIHFKDTAARQAIGFPAGSNDLEIKSLNGGVNSGILVDYNTGRINIGHTGSNSAVLHVKGEGTTASTTAFLVQNSAGSDMLVVKDDRSIETYDATDNVITKNNAGNRRFEVNPNRTNLVDFQVGGSDLSNLIRTDSGINSVGIGVTGLANTRLIVRGSGTTSATTSLLAENSNGDVGIQVLDNGNVGIGGAAQTSATYKLRVHGGLWADSLLQLQTLAGTAGVGSIRYYEGGATLNMNVYGPHASEAVKGILQLRSQDLNYTTLANSILHADPDFLDNPSFVIRSRNTDDESYAMMNYKSGSGFMLKTSEPAGTGAADITFKPSGSTVLFLSSSGNVGIGTTNPTGSLQLLTPSTTTLRVDSTNSFGNGLKIETNGLDQNLTSDGGTFSIIGKYSTVWEMNTNLIIPQQYFYGGGVNFRKRGTTDNLIEINLEDSASPRMLLKGSGTTSATTALQVEDSSSTFLFGVLDDGRVKLPTDVRIYSNTTPFIHNGNSSLTYPNVFIGDNAGNFTSTGTGRNIGIGQNALQDLTTGLQNTGIGWNAGKEITEGMSNTFIGAGAGQNVTTGDSNFGIGAGTLPSITTDNNNVGVGANVFYNLTSGTGNIGIGYQVFNELVDGDHNIGMGTQAGRFNQGTRNVSIGFYTLSSRGSGSYNTIVGYQALQTTTEDNNVAIGYQAGRSANAGGTNDTGSNSVFVGYQAYPSGANDTNEIVIGYQAVGLGSNTAVLGNDSITTTALKGNVGIGTTTPASTFHVDADNNDTAMGIRISNQNSGGRAGFTFHLPNNNNQYYSIGVDNDRNFKIGENNLGTNTRFMITPAGNVGIGTTTPSEKLHVSGNIRVESNHRINLGSTGLSLIHTGTYGEISNYTGDLIIRNTAANEDIIFKAEAGTGTDVELMRIDGSSGNVGIGTTSPSAKLDVYGTISQTVDASANQYPLSFYNNHSGTDYYLLRQRVVNSGNQVRTGLGITGVPDAALVIGTQTDQILKFSTSGRIRNVQEILGTTTLEIIGTDIRLGDGNNSQGGGIVNIVGASNKTPLLIQEESGTSQTRFITFLSSSGEEVLGITTDGGFRATTDTLIKRFSYSHAYSGSHVSDGQGVGISFITDDEGNNLRDIAYIDAVQDDISEDESSLRFSVGETTPTEVMRLQSDGNVGIGTSSPTPNAGNMGVHIKAPTNVSSELKLDTTDSNRGNYITFAKAGVDKWDIHSPADGSLRFRDKTLPEVTTPLTLLDGGNVGINTTSPTALLEVKGSGSASTDTHFRVVEAAGTGNLFRVNQRETIARFLTGSDGILLPTNQPVNYGSSTVYTKRDSTLNAFVYSQGGTEHFAIKDGGNVGIGTTTPAATLHIKSPSNFTNTGSLQIDTTGVSSTQVFMDLKGTAGGDQYIFKHYRAGTLQSWMRNDQGRTQFNTTPLPSYLNSTAYAFYVPSNVTGNLFSVAHNFNNKFIISASGDTTVVGDLTVGGKVTAQEFHTEFVSASIVYSSGSTKFGDTLDDIHQFTGSIELSGSQGIVRIGNPAEANFNQIYLYRPGNRSAITVDTDAGRSATLNFAQGGVEQFKVGMPIQDVGSLGQRFAISYQGNPNFVMDADGIAINKVNPEYDLDVSGSGRFTNDLTVTGSLEVSASIKMTGDDHSYTYPLEITSDSIKLPGNSTSSRSILRQAGSGTGAFLSLRDGSGNEKVMIRSYASSGVQAFFTAGNVGIGTTTPSEKLDVNGTVQATAFVETSARRFKENIEPIEGALDKVINLQGVTFNRIGEEKHEYGFIADEVKGIVPELVTHNAEGEIQGVHYARTVAVLTEAIKELDNKVKAQDLFINDLVARIEKLENK